MTRRANLAALGLWLGGAGCATTAVRPVTPNPVYVPTADFESIWVRTVAVVDQYFDIASENRLSRKIITHPKIGSTLFEPWLGDSVGFEERLESTLQTIRRFAIVTVTPTPNGGYAVKVEVFKELEDMTKPDRQSAGRSVFTEEFPVNKTHDIVGPVPLPQGWIARGRDSRLEQVILSKIRESLSL